MGMYDTIRTDLVFPDGYTGGGLQTKSMGCGMDNYVIHSDGRIEKEPEPPFSGTIRAMRSERPHHFVEYEITIVNDRVTQIEVVPPK